MGEHEWDWPVAELTALRVGRWLGVRVPASRPDRWSFVHIVPASPVSWSRNGSSKPAASKVTITIWERYAYGTHWPLTRPNCSLCCGNGVCRRVASAPPGTPWTNTESSYPQAFPRLP
jgi:hypothetical protein